jgi:hypothetical protein
MSPWGISLLVLITFLPFTCRVSGLHNPTSDTGASSKCFSQLLSLLANLHFSSGPSQSSRLSANDTFYLRGIRSSSGILTVSEALQLSGLWMVCNLDEFILLAGHCIWADSNGWVFTYFPPFVLSSPSPLRLCPFSRSTHSGLVIESLRSPPIMSDRYSIPLPANFFGCTISGLDLGS